MDRSKMMNQGSRGQGFTGIKHEHKTINHTYI